VVLHCCWESVKQRQLSLRRATEFSDSTKLVVCQLNSVNFPIFACTIHTKDQLQTSTHKLHHEIASRFQTRYQIPEQYPPPYKILEINRKGHLEAIFRVSNQMEGVVYY